MNCPESTVIFASKTRSYKDLPIRLSEFGKLHRNEKSGTLNGMFRVRQFVMDDAHVFCRPDQIQSEKTMGTKETWDKAEQQLADALKSHKIDFTILKGEGTFYGPKIHIDFKDFLDRLWTMATIQGDFQIPDRMGLEYIDKVGKAQRPVIIHRAILGTFERFVGIITEQYQGAFPVWLSPIQAIVLPLSDKFTPYAQKVAGDLKSAAIRAEVDVRNETLQAKIRDATLQKIPYLLIVGEKEEKAVSIAVRTREGEDLGQMTLKKFVAKISNDIATRA